jgi:pentatricopeptide repeat protein
MKCGFLECIDIGTCEMWARTEGTGIVSTNARQRFSARSCYLGGSDMNACASVVALKEGRNAHEQIIQRGWESDIFLTSGLVDMYAKCGSMEDASRVFKKRPSLDVVAWNTMISGHVNCGQGQKALELFQEMQKEGVQPNLRTFVGLVNACASVVALEECRHTHRQIIEHGWDSDIIVGNSLIYMYAKCGSMEDTCKVVKNMPSHDVVTWNVMISGCVKCGEGQKALELFHQMEQEGVQPTPVTLVGVLNACASVLAIEEGRSAHEQIIENRWDLNVFVGNSLVDMYAKFGNMEDANRVFNKMLSHDVVTWSVMIFGYVGKAKRHWNYANKCSMMVCGQALSHLWAC